MEEWPARLNMADAYAEAWALTYYLRRSQADGFRAYLRWLRMRSPNVTLSPGAKREAFESAFGPIDEDMIDDWLRFMRELPFKASEATRG
jgi:hypothetical protein